MHAKHDTEKLNCMENFLSLIIAYYVCGYVEVELAAFNAINIERESTCSFRHIMRETKTMLWILICVQQAHENFLSNKIISWDVVN